jgi:hypothetical protein
MRPAVVALAALLACETLQEPCFTPASIVDDPRVISIRVDPPEAVVDLEAGDVPPLSISAVVGTARRLAFRQMASATIVDAPVTATLCLPPLDPKPTSPPGCPAGSPVMASLPRVPDPSAPLVVQPPVELLREALRQDPLQGFGGIRLRLQIDVWLPGNALSAVKTLPFHLAGAPGSVNHPIELAGVEVRYGTGERFVVAPGETVPLVVAQPAGLRPLLARGSGAQAAVEEYELRDVDGRLVPMRERVTYKFLGANSLFFGRPDYTRSGTNPQVTFNGVPADEADEPEPGDPGPALGLVTVTAVFPGEQSGSFWVVARDGRGGEAALQLQFVAAERRPGCGGPPPRGGACPELFFGCL